MGLEHADASVVQETSVTVGTNGITEVAKIVRVNSTSEAHDETHAVDTAEPKTTAHINGSAETNGTAKVKTDAVWHANSTAETTDAERIIGITEAKETTRANGITETNDTAHTNGTAETTDAEHTIVVTKTEDAAHANSTAETQEAAHADSTIKTADSSSEVVYGSIPEPLSMIDALTEGFGAKLHSGVSLFSAMRAPVPQGTGDGSSLVEPPTHSTMRNIASAINDFGSLSWNNIDNMVTMAFKDSTHGLTDDKQYRMEQLISCAAALPPGGLQKKTTADFVTKLWEDLEHPPQVLLGDDHQFRRPDGSNNSIQNPQMGASGMPYARTVIPQTQANGALPDPSVLFDTLMARDKPEGTTHPNKISSMLFYLASIIIHDCFKSNRYDSRVSDTSSYLDLAPLYGSNWKEQKRIRTMKDGKIKPDCFSEVRLLTFPPGVGAILIMFNRYHNYVAEQLALINENNRFTEDKRNPIVHRYGEDINKRDDDLFQTARLVTCGLYINIILIDYVRTILNLNRTDSNWQLDPRIDIPGGSPRGVGNQVSAEFNLVYRWHATVSTRDDAWTQQLFKELIEDEIGVPATEAANPENFGKFMRQLGKTEAAMTDLDPVKRPFPPLKEERAKMERIKEGPFKDMFEDEDLANILTESIEDCANAFGPRQVPVVMKAVEILGIKQARSWNLASLNEFRKHFGLKPHVHFSDITENVEVQEVLKNLYTDPDHVELYPGLVVEDAKIPKIPGSGLCPSYTVSRAVLSDAVSLVRGDRYYTTSYTPATLTNWGYTEASSNLEVDNGCVFYKLFLRALPRSYVPESVYVHFPMTVPHGQDGMQEVLEGLDKSHYYNFDRPRTHKEPLTVFSYKACKEILENDKTFKVTWGPAIRFLMGQDAKNFMLAGDGPENLKSRHLIEHALYQGDSSRATPKGNEKWFIAVRDFFEETTTRLLKEKSFALGGMKQVDIIRDVGNYVSVHFAAQLFGLPLKTKEFPEGIYTEKQLYDIAAAVFTCVFFDLDPPKSFPLRLISRKITQQLGKSIVAIAKAVQKTEHLPLMTGEQLFSKIMPPSPSLRDYGVHMISRMLKQNPDVPELVFGNIMGTFAGMIANQGQVFAQAMDYLLTADQGRHIPELNRLAKEDTPEADEKILHYMLEATRLGAETGVVRQAAHDITIIDETEYLGKRELHFKAGDRVLVNLVSAAKDPIAFKDPEHFNLERPVESYVSLGFGLHQCIGLPMTYASLPTMLKVVAKLDGLRPASMTVGSEPVKSRVKRVMKEFIPGDKDMIPENWHYHVFLTESWGSYFPFPTSMKVNWDSDTLDVNPSSANGNAN